MGKRLSAAVTAILLLGALAGGCGGNGGATPVVAGSWDGTLALTTLEGRTYAGTLALELSQDGDSASGAAVWSPLGEVQGVTMTIDGGDVTLRLSFLCPSLRGGVTLTGEVDGDGMRLGDAQGIACFGRGGDEAVSSGAGELVRVPSAEPL